MQRLRRPVRCTGVARMRAAVSVERSSVRQAVRLAVPSIDSSDGGRHVCC